MINRISSNLPQAVMKFDIITLFPDYFTSPLNESLVKKAITNKILDITTIDLRDYSELPHKQVDDSPYGGGAGMILKPDILAKAVKATKRANSLVILPDPSGKKFDQSLANQFPTKEHLIFVCGRYEGVDQRFREKYVDLEISLGDYVLSGGEAATLVILETIARLIPGVIGNTNSLSDESFSQAGSKLLEYPQYTRPEIFEDLKVPDILLSGDHEKIKKWRLEMSLEKTKRLRPDLLEKKS